MVSMESKREEHHKRNCFFCKLPDRLDKPDEDEESEKYRKLELKEKEKTVFAILDGNPKVLGHTLVISKIPFNDITDHMNGIQNEEKVKVFEVAMKLAERLKTILQAEKVYIMTMCEHWEMWETGDGQTTEHLHFHLVPRYPGMRTKLEAGENLLARKGTPKDKEQLRTIAQYINERLTKDATEPNLVGFKW